MVDGFEEKDGKTFVKLKNVDTISTTNAIPTDMVILAIGVTPDTGLAKNAGISLGMKGSIVVNERMETSLPDIYAVGDAVQIQNFITGGDTLVSLAGPANKQGRIAADNKCFLRKKPIVY